MADEAGGQPTGTGGCNYYLFRILDFRGSGDGQPLPLFRRCQSGWPRSVTPDVRAVARLRKEFRVNQGSKQCIADVALQTPQALSLAGCQAKPGHFYEFTLDSLKHVIDTHTPLRTLDS
jgi:hypothetical protein